MLKAYSLERGLACPTSWDSPSHLHLGGGEGRETESQSFLGNRLPPQTSMEVQIWFNVYIQWHISIHYPIG